MLWICCRTKEWIDFHRKKVGSQIWNNSLREIKKRFRRDGRTRKKQSSNLLGDITLTHICLVWRRAPWKNRLRNNRHQRRRTKNVMVYRDNNRVDDSNIMRPRNGRRIEHVNSSGQKQMQSESHWKYQKIVDKTQKQKIKSKRGNKKTSVTVTDKQKLTPSDSNFRDGESVVC
jgi:hypothetical protein